MDTNESAQRILLFPRLLRSRNACPHGRAVLQNAGPDEKDIIAPHTGSLFIAQTPENFTYDNDGNLLTDGRWQYTWNGENRLIGMETRTNLPPETPRRKLAFHYDSQGRRTAKTVLTPDTNAQWETASTHHFLYDGWNLLSEISYIPSDMQTNTRWFVWGLDLSGTLQGAGGIGGLLAQISGGTTAPASVFFPAYDANGNITEYISTTGTIAAHFAYDPFGNTIAQTGPEADNLPFRFSTKYTDNETALIYYGYRFYKPELGRWPNRDPIGERGGIAIYGFLSNGNINKIDYLGLQGTGSALCCSDTLDTLVKSSPYKEKLEELKNKGCIQNVPSGCAVCRAHSCGVYSVTSKRISICANCSSMTVEEALIHEMQHANDMCGTLDCPQGYAPESSKCCGLRMCNEMKAFFCQNPDSYGANAWEQLADRAMSSMRFCKQYHSESDIKNFARGECPSMPQKGDCFVTKPSPPIP